MKKRIRVGRILVKSAQPVSAERQAAIRATVARTLGQLPAEPLNRETIARPLTKALGGRSDA